MENERRQSDDILHQLLGEFREHRGETKALLNSIDRRVGSLEDTVVPIKARQDKQDGAIGLVRWVASLGGGAGFVALFRTLGL